MRDKFGRPIAYKPLPKCRVCGKPHILLLKGVCYGCAK